MFPYTSTLANNLIRLLSESHNDHELKKDLSETARFHTRAVLEASRKLPYLYMAETPNNGEIEKHITEIKDTRIALLKKYETLNFLFQTAKDETPSAPMY